MIRLSELLGFVIVVLTDAVKVLRPHGIQFDVIQVFVLYAVFAGRFSHTPLHRQRLVVAFEWKIFLVESGGGAVDVMGAGGQEHRQPLRRARVGLADLRQLARHTGVCHVRVEGGAEGGSDADEDEHVEARRVLVRLWVEMRTFRGGAGLQGEDAWSLRARRFY